MAVYTAYIPGIYCLLGGYISIQSLPPTVDGRNLHQLRLVVYPIIYDGFQKHPFPVVGNGISGCHQLRITKTRFFPLTKNCLKDIGIVWETYLLKRSPCPWDLPGNTLGFFFHFVQDVEIREEAIRALGKVANAGGDGGDGRRLETCFRWKSLFLGVLFKSIRI